MRTHALFASFKLGQLYSEFQHDGACIRLVGPRFGNSYSDACTCIVSGVFDTHSWVSQLGAAYYLDLSDEYLLIGHLELMDKYGSGASPTWRRNLRLLGLGSCQTAVAAASLRMGLPRTSTNGTAEVSVRLWLQGWTRLPWCH